jgi:hypothetical protein
MNENPETWLRKLRSRNRLLAAMPWLGRVAEWRQLLRAAKRWRSEGWFTPVPYFVRRAQLLEAGRKIGASIAVETGTFRGDTTAALACHFREVHTIEVVPALADLARERFRAQPSITVWDGDSPQVLRALLPKLNGPTLFYLDGHDSGGVTGKGGKACPVREELEIIFENFSGVAYVVIDDARLFGSDPDYPTLGEIRAWMERLRPGTSVRVENDAILIETVSP